MEETLYIQKLDYNYYDIDSFYTSHEVIGVWKDRNSAQKYLSSYYNKIHDKFKNDEHRHLEYIDYDYNEYYINNIIDEKVFVLNIYSNILGLNIDDEYEYQLTERANNYMFNNLEEAKNFVVDAIDIEIENVKNYFSLENLNEEELKSTENLLRDINNFNSDLQICFSILEIKINSHKTDPIYDGWVEIPYSDIDTKENVNQKIFNYIKNPNEKHYNSLHTRSILMFDEKMIFLNNLDNKKE